MIRQSCKQCKLKYPNIPGDFIVGDSWGIDKRRYGFDSEKVGIVFIMNNKAKSLMESSKSLIFKKMEEDYLKIAKIHNPKLLVHR